VALPLLFSAFYVFLLALDEVEQESELPPTTHVRLAEHRAPLPPCPPFPAFQVEGHWEVDLGEHPGQVAPRLLGFDSGGVCSVPPFEPWVQGKGRRILMVGDSQSRFMMHDVAVAMFACKGLVWVDPWKCEWVHPGLPPPTQGPCADLFHYSCAKRHHSDLHLTDPSSGATLEFVWTVSAEELSRGKARERLMDPQYHAALVNVGLWDVEVKAGKTGEEGAAAASPLSLAHHCSWVTSIVPETLGAAKAANPGLAHSFVWWTPPYGEPHRGNSARFPMGALGVMNECSRVGVVDRSGLHFFNASKLFSLPSRVTDILTARSAAAEGEGKLLSMDGYHPSVQVRKVFLDHLFNHFQVAAQTTSAQ
jgi:hypothetical protein